MRTLQSIIDPFVERAGGKLVTDFIGSQNCLPNADYVFPSHNVIAELKSLQAGGFADSFHRKLCVLTGRWHREGRLIVFGTVGIQSSKLPESCQKEMFDAMAKSIQRHVVAAANKQIKSTKALLGQPNATGLLWVASDGNEDFQPDVVWYLLSLILQKKKSDGSPAYSGINAVAYFNPRMPAKIAGQPKPALFWFSQIRQPDSDGKLERCVSSLAQLWPQYFSWAHGVTVQDIQGVAADVRFSSNKIPEIKTEILVSMICRSTCMSHRRNACYAATRRFI